MKIGCRKLSFSLSVIMLRFRWLLCAGQSDFLLIDKPCQYVKF